jgi:F420-0:gamma-glutamyl ligase
MATTSAQTQRGPRRWTRQDVDDRAYLRLPVRTRWLAEGDDLVGALREYLPPLRADDTVVVSEKVAILLTGRAVPVTTSPRRLARLLARCVRPPEGSYGLSVPAKMQYVLQSVGAGRLLAAAAVSAVTRPFGVHGVFYRLAGPVARDVDGALPPYEGVLFPPLDAAAAEEICDRLEDALGVGVGIVDLNDFGGRVRGTSPHALPAAELARVLADNPLRQRLTGTPFGVVRPLHNVHRSRAAAR